MNEVARTPVRTAWHEGWERTVGTGLVAGIVAAVAMGAFAMVAAATYQGTGFFTPLYHIASPLIGGDAMMASMEAAGGGDAFAFDPGPAFLGAAVHMIVGAVWGAAFFAVARLLQLRGAALLIVSGIVYGLAVMLFMSWITLPITAAVVGGGKPIEDMPTIVGWGTFSAEHALFGLVLGIWAAARYRVALEEPVRVAERRAA
jgi:hypothetical protein